MRFPFIWLGGYFFAIAVIVVLNYFGAGLTFSESSLNTMFISAGIFALAATRNDY